MKKFAWRSGVSAGRSEVSAQTRRLSANQNPELRCPICTGVTLLHWCYT